MAAMYDLCAPLARPDVHNQEKSALQFQSKEKCESEARVGGLLRYQNPVDSLLDIFILVFFCLFFVLFFFLSFSSYSVSSQSSWSSSY